MYTVVLATIFYFLPAALLLLFLVNILAAEFIKTFISKLIEEPFLNSLPFLYLIFLSYFSIFNVTTKTDKTFKQEQEMKKFAVNDFDLRQIALISDVLEEAILVKEQQSFLETVFFGIFLVLILQTQNLIIFFVLILLLYINRWSCTLITEKVS